MTEEVVESGAPAVNVEAEKEARQYGWVSKDEFKGDEADWKDAETFLKRGQEINGFLRKNNEKLEGTNQRLVAELAEIKQTIQEFREFHKESLANAKKRAIEELKKEQATALERGDGERFVEINDQIEEIKKVTDKPAEEKKGKTEQVIIFTPQELNAWNEKNDWYGKNTEMSIFTDELADVLLVKQPELRGQEFLDALTRRVKKEYPEYFENPNRNNSEVSGASGTRPAGSSKKKSYDNLPPEAKAACDKFCKTRGPDGKPLMTREEYVAQYDWE